jgi:hypothetical protein
MSGTQPRKIFFRWVTATITTVGSVALGRLIFFPPSQIPIEQDLRAVYIAETPPIHTVSPPSTAQYDGVIELLQERPVKQLHNDVVGSLRELQNELKDLRVSLKTDFCTVRESFRPRFGTLQMPLREAVIYVQETSNGEIQIVGAELDVDGENEYNGIDKKNNIQNNPQISNPLDTSNPDYDVIMMNMNGVVVPIRVAKDIVISSIISHVPGDLIDDDDDDSLVDNQHHNGPKAPQHYPKSEPIFYLQDPTEFDQNNGTNFDSSDTIAIPTPHHPLNRSTMPTDPHLNPNTSSMTAKTIDLTIYQPIFSLPQEQEELYRSETNMGDEIKVQRVSKGDFANDVLNTLCDGSIHSGDAPVLDTSPLHIEPVKTATPPIPTTRPAAIDPPSLPTQSNDIISMENKPPLIVQTPQPASSVASIDPSSFKLPPIIPEPISTRVIPVQIEQKPLQIELVPTTPLPPVSKPVCIPARTESKEHLMVQHAKPITQTPSQSTPGLSQAIKFNAPPNTLANNQPVKSSRANIEPVGGRNKSKLDDFDAMFGENDDLFTIAPQLAPTGNADTMSSKTISVRVVRVPPQPLQGTPRGAPKSQNRDPWNV